MKGNLGFLIMAAGALMALIAASLGGHIYRWEFITWTGITFTESVWGYLYSRKAE